MNVARTLIPVGIGAGVALAIGILWPWFMPWYLCILLLVLVLVLYMGYRADQEKIRALRHLVQMHEETIHRMRTRSPRFTADAASIREAVRQGREHTEQQRITQALATLEAQDPEFLKRCTIAGMHNPHARADDLRYWCDGRGTHT